MKAIVYEKYGSPDVLEFKEIEKLTPGDDEVLLKTFASSINSWDWDMLTGVPLEYRFISGLLKPKKTNILGCDVAGRVETVGKNIKMFKPGDAVYGDLSEGEWGGFAEFVCARENELTHMPAGMTFEEAAATPQASLLALQAFQTRQEVKPGDHMLINGGCGGVGSFAIQMAKTFGYEVTAVDHTNKLDMMRSLGADHVIDYTKDDFTKRRKGYDFILDVKSDRSVFDYKRVLNPNGVYATVGGKSFSILQIALLGPLIKKKENKTMTLVMHKPNQDLRVVGSLIETEQLKPIIDKSFPLSKTADAFRYFGEGHFKGKIVITS